MPVTAPEPSGWQLEGNAPLAYDKYIVNAFLLGYSHRLVEAAGVQRRGRLLDIACGTGIVTRLAAAETGPEGYVAGLDVNPGMLARARASSGGFPSIDWREGSVEKIPFADSSFDVAFCQHGLQFFPDKAAALAEMLRVLSPAGRVLISVWRSIEHCPWQSAIADAIEHHVGSAPAALVRSAFNFGDAKQLERIVVSAGFRDVELRVDREIIRHASLAEFVPGYLSATPVATAVSALDAETQQEIIADVRKSLAAYLVGDGIAVPIEANSVIAFR